MPLPVSLHRTLAAAACLLALAACAATTPPPRFGTVSPADPDGPEGGLPAAVPMLTGQGELADREASGEATPRPSSAPEGHPHHPGAEAAAATYTCPMHPEIVATEPGLCTVCGMKLMRKAAPPSPEERP